MTGLVNALKLIQPIKDKYPGVTYADLFQLASATAIEVLFFFSCPILLDKLVIKAKFSNFIITYNLSYCCLSGGWWP